MTDLINIKGVKNILVTRTDRLGDVILTLPLISEVKRIFTDSRVLFLVRRYVSDIVSNYESIDELIFEEDIPGLLKKYKFFKEKKIDLIINVKPEFSLALIFFLLRIKYRIGTGYRWYSFLYNRKVYEHRKTSDKHESDYNLGLLKYFIDEVKSEKKFYFRYTDEERRILYEKLSDYNLSFNHNYIIVHPGSGGSAKDLPLEKFTGYVNNFLDEYEDYKVVFTGLENEKEVIEKIEKNIKKNKSSGIKNLAGKLNLRELMILIDNSKLFVSNSTGPIHIAGGLNKNIIGFYPNEKPMNETRWRPLGDNVTIIKPLIVSDDMSSIEVNEIMKATRNILK